MNVFQISIFLVRILMFRNDKNNLRIIDNEEGTYLNFLNEVILNFLTESNTF